MNSCCPIEMRSVTGPDGNPLTLGDLPPSETSRWGMYRKAKVVVAVRGGLLSIEEACRRYALTQEEFGTWQRQMERYGVQGLRATRAQFYRE